MKKITILLSIIFVLAASPAFGYIGRLYPSEAMAGETTHFILTFYNKEDSKTEDSNILLYFPYAGVYSRSTLSGLRSGDSGRVYFTIDLEEEVQKGYHPVIISSFGEEERHRKHTWVYIE